VAERSDNAERLFQHLGDKIIDRFANEGRGTVTVIETLQDVIAKRRLAYDRDPDPAEDVEEPSNDWPAAATPSTEVKE
jgi:hypothetical protein